MLIFKLGTLKFFTKSDEFLFLEFIHSSSCLHVLKLKRKSI